jgi:ATP-dependent DNA helicase RecQ
MNITRAEEILKHSFGYDTFRHHQREAIETLLAGRDCVVLMPTGGGKSLCYQIPALMFDGLTVVISPLIALMKDQVDALRGNGINAAFLNSTQTGQEQVDIFRRIRSGELKLLYVAPERIMQNGDQFLDFLRSVNVSLFAIDEAHCVSSWGHDFRPEYRQLAILKRAFARVPVVALTATADEPVRRDIVERLAIPEAKVLVSSFNRPNIKYIVQPKRNSYSKLLEFLESRGDESGIVYCLSRASVERLAEDLQAEGFAALPYHAGLDKKARDENQNKFLNDEAKIIVATIAFGMGIDKPNVRFVVHMDLPKNIESYYQETGRAGRDGLPSEALLFFSLADVIKLRNFAEVEGDPQQTEIMLQKLEKMGHFGELKTCRRRYLLEYFDERLDEDCGNCDNCQTEFENFDGTILAQKALSAVARTGQRFGLSYLVEFLRGSKSQKIREEHKELKTYGVGSDLSKEEWTSYFKQLIAQGLLMQTGGTYPIISLTERSGDVLRGSVAVKLVKAAPLFDESDADTGVPQEYDRELFDLLRRERLEIAREEQVPPYIIFSDVTLVEMAAFFPQSPDEMVSISGVGDVKLERYGERFITLIAGYCATRGIKSKPKSRVAKKAARQRSARGLADTFKETLRMFRAGKSVESIAAERGLAISTIEGHLARFVETGEIGLQELVPLAKAKIIRAALIEADAGEAVGPVKTRLGEDFSYGEIRAVMADFARQTKEQSRERSLPASSHS